MSIATEPQNKSKTDKSEKINSITYNNKQNRQKINKDIEDLKNTINQFRPYIYKPFHPTSAKIHCYLKENQKTFELNENKNTTYQNSQDAAKKRRAVNVYSRKRELSQINNLGFYLQAAEKQTKPS